VNRSTENRARKGVAARMKGSLRPRRERVRSLQYPTIPSSTVSIKRATVMIAPTATGESTSVASE
jgi:hypothetical protein